MSLESTDRRSDVRAAVSIMGTIESDDGEQPIVLLNLSASGAMIQTHEPPRSGAHYTLHFSVQKRPYRLRFEVVNWIQQGGSFGWRGPFASMSPDEAAAIQRAVHAAAGLSGSTLRGWQDVSVEAGREPSAKVLVGSTPGGQDIHVLGQDVLEMGADGLELYARLICELETI